MIDRKDFQKLHEIIRELSLRSENGAVIIVEGLKDVASLRGLGIRGDIFMSSNTPDAVLVDRIGNKDVIILTDCDRRGEILERSLVSKFSSWGIAPDVEFKKRIFSIVSRDIIFIENLANYYRKLEDELNFGVINGNHKI
ncbi:MAG TPA: hypothetical protein EYP30_01320 [Archaeoglobaceae archaeon]|nr:hypothetical protein [Archaeoglobaceae archaeon]